MDRSEACSNFLPCRYEPLTKKSDFLPDADVFFHDCGCGGYFSRDRPPACSTNTVIYSTLRKLE
jgi:hypothetical protein